LSDDPNHPAAVAHRAETLRAAWRPAVADRIEFLEDRCRDRLVLDIGCVAHDVERMNSSNWLHGRIAAVAKRCVGVDVLPEGVAAMRQRGFDVVEQDLGSGLGQLAEIAPFDVIVAGELIEHVEALDMLFNVASEALAPDGKMIITTPNPYAPHRVRAAQLGIVWENVDHILYAFPSGIAELAERHGLVLAEAATTNDSVRLSLKDRLRAVKRRIRGRQWRNVGYSTLGERRVRSVGFGMIGATAHGLWWPGRRFLGETFVYVVKRPGWTTLAPAHAEDL
jgi:SAM-dependent methyltransferase